MPETLDVRSTPSVPPNVRGMLEKLLYGDLGRYEALDVVVTLEQHLDDYDDDIALEFPDVPVITAGDDGSMLFVGDDEGSTTAGSRIRFPAELAREIERHANQEDRREAHSFLWDLSTVLRSQIEVMLLYEEMIFGHLVLVHRQEVEELQGISEDEWYEVHRQLHASQAMPD